MEFFGLGIGIGWDDDKHMLKSAISAFCILALYIILKLCGVPKWYVEPFSSAICILGGNILFLAYWIMSSKYYHDDWNGRYICMNA